MWGNYIDRVLEEYQKKQLSNTLSPQLRRPTTTKLRKACEILYSSATINKEDEKILYDFFNLTGDKSTYLQTIRKFDVDKFRPLLNFINRKTNKTDEKNIELLALLIDFKKRPFELGESYLPEDRKDTEDNRSKVANNIEKEAETPGIKVEVDRPVATPGIGIEQKNFRRLKFRIRRKQIWIGVVFIILITSISFLVLTNNKKAKFGSASNESCMYWTGDHYARISCEKKINDGIVVALDSDRLEKFRRITKTDTITQNAIGYVWYYKKDGQLEYYTSGGYHPIYINDSLKPITRYIITKHLGKEIK
jgi:hypothetical protein